MGRKGAFIASGEIDLSGEVRVGVLFVPHRARRVLRIPQIVLGVGDVHAVRQRLFIARRPDRVSLFSQNDRCSRVLTERQHTRARYIGVLEHRQRDHAVVIRRCRVIQDGSHLLQMRGAQEEVDVVKGLRGQQRKGFGCHAEHVVPFP